MKKLLLLIMLSFPVSVHADPILKFFVMNGDNAQDVYVGSATFANYAQNLGIYTSADILIDKVNISNLQNLLLLYANQYVTSLNFGQGSGVNVDTTTVGRLSIINHIYVCDSSTWAAVGQTTALSFLETRYSTKTIVTSGLSMSSFSGIGVPLRVQIIDKDYNLLGETICNNSSELINGINISQVGLLKNTTYSISVQLVMGINFSGGWASNLSDLTGDGYYGDLGGVHALGGDLIFKLSGFEALASASYSQTISTTSVSVFNVWGKFNLTKYEDSGSSITTTVKLSSDSVHWGNDIPVINGTLLPYTSTYIQTNISFSRWVSTANPYVSNAGFSVNYAPPLYTGDLMSATTQNITAPKNFTSVNPSTFTALNVGTLNLIPPGMIMTYISSNAPAGYLYCNGASVSTTTYSALYFVIGFTFGNAGGGNMKLPDMRGMFLRGLDNGRGYDPDGSFRVVGSTQSDMFQGHRHNSVKTNGDIAAGASYNQWGTWVGDSTGAELAGYSGVGSPRWDEVNGQPRYGLETRPKNIDVVYIIKY